MVKAAELLKKHQVEFNTLTVVNRANSKKPREVYRFLRDLGSGFMQFIPLVERQDKDDEKTHDLEGPPQTTQMGGRVSPVGAIRRMGRLFSRRLGRMDQSGCRQGLRQYV